MDSFVIDCVSWYNNIELRQDITERFYVIYRFLEKNELTVKNTCTTKEKIGPDFCINSSDLNAIGIELIKKVYPKWVSGIDKGKNPNDTRILEKALVKIRMG